MADEAPARLLLIVTGSTLRAEQVDRPLAYYLQQRIYHVLESSDLGPFQVLVVADFRWIHDEPLQKLPTISVGGPGVNALAHRWWREELPLSLEVDGQYYIQAGSEPNVLRASIWGMDNATTQIAVSVFVDRFLPQFLEQCEAGAPYPEDLEETD
jgi:hypothetical protein